MSDYDKKPNDIMTFNEAKEYLYNFGEFNIDLGLSRVKLLLGFLLLCFPDLITGMIRSVRGKTIKRKKI